MVEKRKTDWLVILEHDNEPKISEEEKWTMMEGQQSPHI